MMGGSRPASCWWPCAVRWTPSTGLSSAAEPASQKRQPYCRAIFSAAPGSSRETATLWAEVNIPAMDP